VSGISHDYSKILRKVWTNKEMIKNIFIIGESQIAFASGGRTSAGIPKPLEFGSFERSKSGYELKFVWQHSRTAFGINYEYLESFFKDHLHHLGKNSVIVSEFGAMDAAFGHYQKHGNMQEIVTKYFNNMLKFCKDHNTELLILCPWWMVEDDQFYKIWYDITDLFKKLSKENGLKDPIEIMHTVLERKYEVVDEWKHNTREDSEKIVDYIIAKVSEYYGND
jgi:hypothetical protein